MGCIAAASIHTPLWKPAQHQQLLCAGGTHSLSSCCALGPAQLERVRLDLALGGVVGGHVTRPAAGQELWCDQRHTNTALLVHVPVQCVGHSHRDSSSRQHDVGSSGHTSSPATVCTICHESTMHRDHAQAWLHAAQPGEICRSQAAAAAVLLIYRSARSHSSVCAQQREQLLTAGWCPRWAGSGPSPPSGCASRGPPPCVAAQGGGAGVCELYGLHVAL